MKSLIEIFDRLERAFRAARNGDARFVSSGYASGRFDRMYEACEAEARIRTRFLQHLCVYAAASPPRPRQGRIRASAHNVILLQTHG
jgi:hypothetical protein